MRKLELGILVRKRERLEPAEQQLAMKLIGTLVGGDAVAAPPLVDKVRAHERNKPTGRRPLPQHLPRVDVEVIR